MKNIASLVALFFVGFIGMFICFLILAYGDIVGIHLPFYAVTYPLVYPLLAAIWSVRHRDLPLANGLVVCLAPLLYFFLVLWSDGTLRLRAITINDATSMIVIMPATMALSALAALAAVRLKTHQVTTTTAVAAPAVDQALHHPNEVQSFGMKLWHWLRSRT